MNEDLKFDHFKNINELLEHIDIWYKEDDIDYTRWFHLEDLKKVKDYITNLQQENKQLKEEIKKIVVDNLTQINIERESEFVSLILKIIQEKEEIIDKAIEILKDTSVDMPSTLLIETIDYARHILGDKE